MSVVTYDYSTYSYDQPVSYDDPLQQLGIGCRISAHGGCQGSKIYNAAGLSYNQALYIYNPTTCPNGSLSIQARISKHTAQTLLIRAHIKNRTAQTLLIRADIKNRTSQTVTCRARVSRRSTATITCQANISLTGRVFQNFTCQVRIMPYKLAIQASIKNTVNRQIAMQVRCSRQQGFPIINPGNPAFPLFQPTQLIVRANIVNNITLTARTMLLNCAISPRRSASLLVNCRVNHSGRVSIQANITPKFKTTTVLGTFNIEGAFGLTVLGYFNINGLYSRPTVGVGARIVRLVSRRVCGHFIIPAQPSTGPVSTLTAGGVPSSRANLGIGAFIS